MSNTANIGLLVKKVRENPTLALHGQLPEVHQLAELGAPAVGAVLKAMHLPTPEGRYSRDVIEALGTVLREVARRDPSPLLAVLDQDAVQPEPDLMFVVFALNGAKTRKVTPHLLRAQGHRAVTVRWAAAKVLAGFGTTAARGAMVTALRDRSSIVRFVAVDALTRKRRLWSEEAVPLLRRIVAMPSVAKHSPGMLRMAQELLERA